MDSTSAWRHMAALAGHWVLRGFGVWAVVEKTTGNFVGSIGLWRPEGWPELELGYWLVPEARGTGYATEAGAKCRDFAFETLRAETLVSYIAPENEPSKRVAERLGARYEQTIELLKLGPHCVYRYPNSQATGAKSNLGPRSAS
jgi:RimJ/RimL family protein N-acetyltransferase